MKHENDGDTNCNWCARHSHQRISIETGGLIKERKNSDYPDYGIIIGQNTEESWRLLVTCSHSNSSEKPTANAGVENFQGSTK